MRGRRLFVASLVAVPMALGGIASSPAHAYANCPDKMWPVVATSRTDFQKDQNNNGVVCKHLDPQGSVSGGPDDTQDDVI